MPDSNNKLLEKYRAGRQWLSDKTAPIRAMWVQILAPLQPVLTPVRQSWNRATAPLRNAWAGFKSRFPRMGWALGWAGTFLRWGIYFLLFLVVGVGIGLFGSLPSSEELRNIETANATEVYSADSVLIGKYYMGENRTEISIDNVSPYIINALIATEDRRFLEHSGIDFTSWLRVGFGVLSGKGMGGGSTLSQQLAKNLYGRKNYFIPGLSIIINKIRENFISVRLERIYNKQELLNLYLNTVPFGGDIYGISVASRAYFNKKPQELTVDQAAALVGMLKGTSIYHPVRRAERAQERRNVVLRQMVRNGHLTENEYAELSKKPVGAKNYNVDGNNDGLGTYFREYLRTDVMPKLLKNLKNEDGEPYNLYTGGLKIYTTLDSRMQQFAEDAVQKHMGELQKQFDQHWKNEKKEKPWGDDKWIDQQVKGSARWGALKDAGLSDEQAYADFLKPVKMTVFSWKKGGGDQDTLMTPFDSVKYYFCLLNCGFMSMEHRTGYVRAWVGGINFKHFKLDHIEGTRRQVGSTFKPIVYAAAIQDSLKPCSYLPNEIKKIVDWEPHNADESYGGWYSLTGGLTKSVNVIAAQLIEKVGIQRTIDLARKMGISTELKREFGISLGATDISLLEMMKVYGTIANQGKRPEPVTVLRVLDRNKKVIFDYHKELAVNPNLGPHEEALTVNQAATMVEMMKNVINHGTGQRFRRYAGYDCEFAGKTGTTQNHSDGWFICFNPVMVTGAWVGGNSPAVRFRSMYLGQGSAMALPIVGNFWHSIATKGGKLSKILAEKFPPAKPEVLATMGCQPWINIPPDSFFTVTNVQDSTLRDSLMKMYTAPIKKGEETPGGEGVEKEPADKPEEKEKKEGLLKRLFKRKDDND
ncbi:MAG: transglycosylase domain-containing protein [Saprospiraceae bacterium]|nr:transglycosylase domain-containing protein [Saprospiraceae bacterium]